MTKDQLLSKWSAYGTLAALKDTGMTPCYSEDIMFGTDIEDLLLHGREQWETTDHFWIKYGQLMHQDALSIVDLYSSLSSTQDFKEVFWNAWEDEIGAQAIIEEIKERALAKRMLGYLEIRGHMTVGFTDKATRQNAPEFVALARWLGKTHAATRFALEQAYCMLDLVVNEGLESLVDEIPEADVYTTDLANWLAETVWNLAYITEVLREQHFSDAVCLLQEAQRRAIQDLWISLADMLRNYLK